MKITPLLMIMMSLVAACGNERSQSASDDIFIDSVNINGLKVQDGSIVDIISHSDAVIRIAFSSPVDPGRFNRNKLHFSQDVNTTCNYSFAEDSLTLIVEAESLKALTPYTFRIDAGSNAGRFLKEGFQFSFVTALDSSAKFPLITDDSLLALVQRQTLRYFTDYAHPVSGMTRERSGSGDVVTSGGTGFGLMALLVGIQRNFISREQGFGQIQLVVDFLRTADNFHGAFPHRINGSTGKVYPFSMKDNGGDLVETAFLMQGLLTVREFFRNGSVEEKALCDTITRIWEKVEWDWYRKNEEKLYRYWSPVYNWDVDEPVSGWSEALMVYVLAASSPTHSITSYVYDEGWARNGAYPMKNGNTFYNIELPLGEDYGGPLYFAHHSFLGLDPRNLSDKYAFYWQQNVAHSLINYNYCIVNPKSRSGYSADCWGLTASDIPNGYSVSSPLNDLGVIAPAAAISSMPYTPSESMGALKFFYYVLGDRLWGEYGFTDAFSLNSLWFADSYLAVDQGPVVCMIENYRSGFLWDLFMKSEEIRKGLTKLGFTFGI